MVSSRCVSSITSILVDMGIPVKSIELGTIDLQNNLSLIQELDFKNKLKTLGFELIEDNKLILSEKIKLIIIDMIHFSEETIKINFSVYLSDKMKHNYTYLSNIFRSVNGMTIQQFIIFNKIERIKELLFYGELNLSEISYKLNYSSIGHLSNQFKKITGESPSEYKHKGSFIRTPLEDIVRTYPIH
jgi:YesN/AraC family two-component response regulator